MTQHIIIAIILAACILYAAFRIYGAWSKAAHCHDGNYRCAGCAFQKQCEKRANDKFSRKNKVFKEKMQRKFGGTENL